VSKRRRDREDAASRTLTIRSWEPATSATDSTVPDTPCSQRTSPFTGSRPKIPELVTRTRNAPATGSGPVAELQAEHTPAARIIAADAVVTRSVTNETSLVRLEHAIWTPRIGRHKELI
jgi:cytoskeletal protein RodZ